MFRAVYLQVPDRSDHADSRSPGNVQAATGIDGQTVARHAFDLGELPLTCEGAIRLHVERDLLAGGVPSGVQRVGGRRSEQRGWQ